MAGFILPRMSKPSRRVVVFIDAQNLYEGLRARFCASPLHYTDGQFDPMALAELLVSRGPSSESWTLAEVRAYVGRPSAVLQPKTAAAHARQTRAWQAAGVTVRARDLQYIDWPTRPPRQKGVDVELATDVFRLAGGAYDIGIVASFDTDLIPAIEAVYAARGTADTPRICVVGFAASSKRLRLPDARGPRLYCFYLNEADYLTLRDPTDFTS